MAAPPSHRTLEIARCTPCLTVSDDDTLRPPGSPRRLVGASGAVAAPPSDAALCRIMPSRILASRYVDSTGYMVAPAEALALIPDELSAVEAGPPMCAGITTFNSLRHSGALPGDLVAVLGIGGLGHLGVQFAAKMGFRPSRLPEGPTRNRWPGSSGRGATSTARRRIRPTTGQ